MLQGHAANVNWKVERKLQEIKMDLSDWQQEKEHTNSLRFANRINKMQRQLLELSELQGQLELLGALWQEKVKEGEK